MHFEIRSTDGDIVALVRYLSAREGEFFNSDRYGPRAARQRARRPIQPPPGTRAGRSSLSAAGSSVMAHIVQGFALCATSMHPEGYWQWSKHLNGYEPLIEWERMDDRTLRDIGVSRHAAYRRARHPRWI